MNSSENLYDCTQLNSENGLKYFFISEGRHYIIKAVEYSFVRVLFDKNICNLGFGDYDVENDVLRDDINSNNGDVYRVFNTILSTIPAFFEVFKDCMLLVRGSDSSPEFVEKCKLNCKKKCGKGCRKFNQRIDIYTEFINKHYEALSIDYQFLGGKMNVDEEPVFTNYVPHEKYDLVLLSKKDLILQYES